MLDHHAHWRNQRRQAGDNRPVPIRPQPVEIMNGVPRYEGEHFVLGPGRKTLVLKADGKLVERAIERKQEADSFDTKPATPKAPPQKRSEQPAVASNGYARPQHLQELLLREQTRRVDADNFAHGGGDAPPVQRLCSHSMDTLDDKAIGKRPILPLDYEPQGYGRDLPNDPNWLQRVVINFPLLYPKDYISNTDVFDYDLSSHGSSPAMTEALEEIMRVAVDESPRMLARLRPKDDEAEKDMSPLAQLLLFTMRSLAARSPFPEDMNLRRPRSGCVMMAVVTALRAAGIQNIVSQKLLVDRFGVAGEQLFKALAAALPMTRGLQHVLNRCYAPLEPRFLYVAPTAEEVEVTRKEKPDVLAAFIRDAKLPESLPLVEAAANAFSATHFANLQMVGVQHVLATQTSVLGALERHGLAPKAAHIVGIPYSTSFITQAALQERGVDVCTPLVTNPREVEHAIEEKVIEQLRTALQNSQPNRPILVLDDGAHVAKAILKYFAADASRFRVVEQTTRGLRELERLSPLPFAVISAAGAKLKSHESPKIGAEAFHNLRHIMGCIGLGDFMNKEATVLGYGMIGSGLCAALRDAGMRVTVFDTDPIKMAMAERDGFTVSSDRASLMKGKALVVGCTGKQSVSKQDLALMSHETAVGSLSSGTVEIDDSATFDEDVECVPLLAEGPADQRFITRVWRYEKKDIVLLRNGFPLNFNGKLETGTFESIEPTRALMVLCAGLALQTDTPGIHTVPLAMQRDVYIRAGQPQPDVLEPDSCPT